MSPRMHVTFGVVASIAVVGALSWGFVLVGSPAVRRLERFDQRRLQDLQAIAREIQWMVLDPNKKGALKQPLPKTLNEAAAGARNERLNLQDPETGEPYGYTVKNETTYEICATFTRPHNSDRAVLWNHAAGRHCFTVNVLERTPF